ncbi:MAG: lipid A export permease/ATP-binding protein MsbA [Desulfuromonadaceae bacterium]|nr:lipid A export permease/ATP-binding protein MsbA [Desulfuromonadaceae bacterium]MDD2848205.1 lipid A export permease/ATP-binding protein MsbA [Desulfuromonadaceae bacterium]MDD4130628.1 lipid A export permease/ATP-binding protein MsbA [Desulfuromonadaceae bacterium]
MSNSTFGRIVHYSKKYWGRIAISTLASVAVGTMDGGFAYMVEPLLRKTFATNDKTIFTLLPIGVLALFAVRAISRFLNDYFIRTAGELAVQDIRNDLYRNSMHLGLRFYHQHPTGSLMSRVLSDVAVMQSGIGNVVTSVCRDGFSAISLLVVIFYRSWELALITFVVIPLTIYSAQKIGKRIKRLSGQSQEKIGDVAAILQETYTGIKVVKAFVLEDWVIQRFRTTTNAYYNFVRKAIKYNSISAPVIEMITSIGIAGVIWVGGSMVMRGELTSAEFFSFLTAMVLVYKPVKSLNNSYNIIQTSIGAAVRVFEIIDEKPELTNAENAVSIERAAGDVEFRDVSFAYDGEKVLNNINLSASRGEIIALVGPSGGGKSTLVSLIPRFYDVTSGVVLVDGTDIRSLRMADLMRQVALVDQETMLFNDTIANNIRYGNFSASDSEVEAAAKAAFAHDFILEMPEGYSTNIGDRGVRLSGGQRQRICIARALIKDAPILIMDEATSALDTESEQMVQKALDNLMANRTTFVIAHRLSTILHADKILVLEDGRIVESGSHSELLKSSGLYSRLHSLQFSNSGTAETRQES